MAQFLIFASHFSKFRAPGMLQAPKWQVVLMFLIENKVFYFSKKAL